MASQPAGSTIRRSNHDGGSPSCSRRPVSPYRQLVRKPPRSIVVSGGVASFVPNFGAGTNEVNIYIQSSTGNANLNDSSGAGFFPSDMIPAGSKLILSGHVVTTGFSVSVFGDITAPSSAPVAWSLRPSTVTLSSALGKKVDVVRSQHRINWAIAGKDRSEIERAGNYITGQELVIDGGLTAA